MIPCRSQAFEAVLDKAAALGITLSQTLLADILVRRWELAS